jgi:IS30 family transposase
VDKVRNLLAENCSLSLRMIASELNATKETIRSTVTRDLGKRKFFAKFVPHNLLDEQNLRRLDACDRFCEKR